MQAALRSELGATLLLNPKPENPSKAPPPVAATPALLALLAALRRILVLRPEPQSVLHVPRSDAGLATWHEKRQTRGKHGEGAGLPPWQAGGVPAGMVRHRSGLRLVPDELCGRSELHNACGADGAYRGSDCRWAAEPCVLGQGFRARASAATSKKKKKKIGGKKVKMFDYNKVLFTKLYFWGGKK